MSLSPHICLIGFGNMGKAIFDGFQKSNSKAKISIVSPNIAAENHLGFSDKIQRVTHIKDLIGRIDLCLLAVKPQIMRELCLQIKDHVSNDALILSLAAGCSISFFQKIFGQKQPIIRAMPNTPCAIQKGVVVARQNEFVSKQQEDLTKSLLSPLGYFTWVDKEDHINIATALSGSGPAFVFLFLQALSDAAIELGLQEDIAKDLALETVVGSSSLAKHLQDVDFEQLRQNVTSKNGTTQAGLNVLMQNDQFKDLIHKTLQSAYDRACELSHPDE